jgi:hypothetical protein
VRYSRVGLDRAGQYSTVSENMITTRQHITAKQLSSKRSSCSTSHYSTAQLAEVVYQMSHNLRIISVYCIPPRPLEWLAAEGQL